MNEPLSLMQNQREEFIISSSMIKVGLGLIFEGFGC